MTQIPLHSANYLLYQVLPITARFSTQLVRVAGCALIVHDRILLIRRGPNRTFPHEYEIPGGKIEPGESPLQAAIRETFEETGICLTNNVHPVQILYTAPRSDPLTVDFEFHLFKAHLTTTPPIYLETGHTDARWTNTAELPQLITIIGTIELFNLCLR